MAHPRARVTRARAARGARTRPQAGARIVAERSRVNPENAKSGIFFSTSGLGLDSRLAARPPGFHLSRGERSGTGLAVQRRVERETRAFGERFPPGFQRSESENPRTWTHESATGEPGKMDFIGFQAFDFLRQSHFVSRKTHFPLARKIRICDKRSPAANKPAGADRMNRAHHIKGS